MSDSHLPDDVRRWPKDPFALLGISRNVDARELRRAYTRLIRDYKPEHCPDQFRLIREAYESAQRWVAWNAPAPAPEETSILPASDVIETQEADSGAMSLSDSGARACAMTGAPERRGQAAIAKTKRHRSSPSRRGPALLRSRLSSPSWTNCGSRPSAAKSPPYTLGCGNWPNSIRGARIF